MRQSKLFSKTSKTSESGAKSVNHDLLARAGFVDQLMAGVYSYLPLGQRVLDKVRKFTSGMHRSETYRFKYRIDL